MNLLLSGECFWGAFDPMLVYMKTEGLMKLIKSLSDIAVRSCVVGENG